MLHHLMPHVPKIKGVKICIDHFGSPPTPLSADPVAFNAYKLAGFEDLVSLLNVPECQVYVKLSAPYRFSSDPQLRDIEALSKALLETAPERCVFATDWPHTRHEGVDVMPFVEGLVKWAEEVGGKGLVEKVFRKNAKRLFDAMLKGAE